MKKITLVCLLASVSLGMRAGSFAPQPGEINYTLLQSTSRAGIHEVLGTPFSIHYVPGMDKFIDLDAAKASHEYDGIGVSMTDASCWLIDRLGEETGGRLLNDTFGKDGMNMSIIRLNCGASDYSTALYDYNDTKDDVAMKHFSIARDEQYLIPTVKKAISLRNDMFVFSSIWSCPGWMKTNGQMCGGSLLDKYMPAFANYWAAYCKAYGKAGVRIDAITVQNEPLVDQNGQNPATFVSTDQEKKLVAEYLPASFRKAGVKPQIWIHDYNYKTYQRVFDLLADENVRKNADAVAWHPYAGDPKDIRLIRAQYPGLKMHEAERGMNFRDTYQNEKWCADLVFDALNNGCSSYTAWNLALDEDGQPLTGKFFCRGLFEVSLDYTSYKPTPLCIIFRHLGPYVAKKAQIMDVPQVNPLVKTIVFRNPDGSHVIVAASDNHGADRQRIQIKYKGQYMIVSLPLKTWSVTTIIIPAEK